MKSMKFAPLACAVALGFLGTLPALAQADKAAPAASSDTALMGNFKSRQEMISYAIGVTTARNLNKDGVEIDPAMVLKGLQDSLSGQRTLMTEQEIKSVMNGLVTEMRQKMAANRHEAEGINKTKGEEFRAKYAKEAGVKSLPNGVLYKIQTVGTGPKPTEEDSIVVSYRGTLINGKQFDGTPEGKPTTLKLANLIVGWKEAVKLMPTGSHWTLVIPSNLAYGVRGVGADIGPNETLIFDVDLVGITK